MTSQPWLPVILAAGLGTRMKSAMPKVLHAVAGRPMVESQVSLKRIFHRDLIGTTLQTTLVIGAFMCIYYSVNYWYPTLLSEGGRDTLVYLVAFNVGAIAGTLTWGSLSQTRLGRRGAVTITVLVGMASLPLYLHATTTPMMILGAALLGFFGMGVWGMAPAYTVERFPAEVRGAGPGFCYHAGAAIGAMMPFLLGALRDRGFDLGPRRVDDADQADERELLLPGGQLGACGRRLGAAGQGEHAHRLLAPVGGDPVDLVAVGVEGAILGTALYEGRFSLEDALRLTWPGRFSS
jgi:hypothetical protein